MNYLIGIEREGFRIDGDGNMAMTPHPAEFGDKTENSLIGTDFGEPMIELRTPPCPDAKGCYKALSDVTCHVLGILFDKGEFIWPYSLPYKVPDEEHFPYNSYPGRQDWEDYEWILTKVYGLWHNCISGIHVSFSVGDKALREMREIYPNVPQDKDEAYFRCARQIIKHEKALRHFFDASPTDYAGTLTEDSSFRNSPEGYRNEKFKKLDYGSKEAYARTLPLTQRYERLGPVRLKGCDKYNYDVSVISDGVERLEFRLCDIDPFDICGISQNEIQLTAAVIASCMVCDDMPNDPAKILKVCADVDSRLCLGTADAIDFYMEREKQGITKSGIVRRFIAEKGYQGFLELAAQYGKYKGDLTF